MIIAFWLICGLGAAAVASSKKRNILLWLLLGILLGPIGLLIVGLMGRSETPGNDERKCPYCAEIIKKQASVCKYCGKEVGAISSTDYAPSIDQQDAIRRAAEIERDFRN